MKLLLLLLLTLPAFSTKAQFASDHGSPITMTCIVILTVMCLLLAGVVYLLMNNNKRGGINESNNLGENT